MTTKEATPERKIAIARHLARDERTADSSASLRNDKGKNAAE
jgi:hypothetical protein